jgi:ribonucleoside-diphosphate reductase beta chain
MILEPGFHLTLRPMRYPQFYQHYLNAIKNTWTVDEISWVTDIADIRDKLTPAEQHVVNRLIAFFATGDSVVGNNLVLNLYKHVNSPEARMYYSRQIYEEALHVQAYLTLLDNYLPDEQERFEAFDAINNVPSIKHKADFCFKWIDSVSEIAQLDNDTKKQQFLLNLVTFASAIEGMFFMASFAYVYFLRSKGLLHGLASATNWIFRDESLHMNVAFDIVDVVRQEYPHLWTRDLEQRIVEMLSEAIQCELLFADDTLALGVAGLGRQDMEQYLKYCADLRLTRLGIDHRFGNGKNPFPFMELQDLDSHTNFFERTVSSYQIGGVTARAEDVKFGALDF